MGENSEKKSYADRYGAEFNCIGDHVNGNERSNPCINYGLPYICRNNAVTPITH